LQRSQRGGCSWVDGSHVSEEISYPQVKRLLNEIENGIRGKISADYSSSLSSGKL